MTIILRDIRQGSAEWLSAKCGCISASNASLLLVGGKGVTRQNYIVDVASERMSGSLSSSISTWDMERGLLLEPFAVEAYEIKTGFKVDRVGIGYLDKAKRISASPDGLITKGGMEIKCQMAKNHLRTIIAAKNPKKFEAQLQFSMWVFGVDFWDYCSFCPEFLANPLFIMRVNRSDDFIKKLQEATKLALIEIDEIVHNYSIEAKKEIIDVCNDANNLIDAITNKEPGII